jgi:hypothetical protein
MTTANKFQFNNALLKNVRDRKDFLTATVKSTQTEYLPDGTIRSRFIASRNVTIYDPALVALIKTAVQDTSEFPVNCSGYMTSTVRGQGDDSVWYDNQIITELTVLN